MRKILLGAVILILVSAGAAFAQGQTESNTRLNRDPERARIITSDIPNFWRAFDQMTPDNDLFVFKREYLDKGSSGLKDFSKARFTVCDLVNAVEANKNQYASARPDSLKIDGMKNRMIASFRRLKELYPEAVFGGASRQDSATCPRRIFIGNADLRRARCPPGVPIVTKDPNLPRKSVQ